MQKIKVGYLGPPGTYSHQAAIQQFQDLESIYCVEYVPQKSIDACFKIMQDKSVDYALVPFENSSNGQVVFTYDLFYEWFMYNGGKNPNFEIISEQYVAIHHNLITYATDVSQIKKIYSHPQVWTQCRRFLADYESVEKQDTSSTSKAVENVVAEQDPSIAAIGASTASKVHNVPILKVNIEDNASNTTRFLCLGRKSSLSDLTKIFASSSPSKTMSLVTFTIKDNHRPGGLCDILEQFKIHQLNLQSITTRPSCVAWQYVFFVEVWNCPDGLKEEDTPGKELNQCISEIIQRGLVQDAVVLGSFVAERFK
jgi:prephenate dehydratase